MLTNHKASTLLYSDFDYGITGNANTEYSTIALFPALHISNHTTHTCYNVIYLLILHSSFLLFFHLVSSLAVKEYDFISTKTLVRFFVVKKWKQYVSILQSASSLFPSTLIKVPPHSQETIH